MKTIHKHYLVPILVVIILTGLTSYTFFQPGNTLGERLKQALDKYNSTLPGEKIYLHLDKPFYKPGDDIWFKAYLLESRTHYPSAISDVAYVELINPKGNVEKKLTLPVNRGITTGDFQISESMPGGIYKVRAYTNWMKNEGGTHVFEREVQVQKVVFPRLLLKLEFEREAYGSGDNVAASLNLRTLEDAPLGNYGFSAEILIGGAKVKELTGKTNSAGDATIAFTLPEKLKTNDGLVNVLIYYEGNRESISRSIPIVLNHIDLQFFPEGGDLVQSAKTRVAFKALDEFGEPADVEGIIYSENNREIVRFSSYHDGMGTFNLLPGKGTYYAKITRPEGIEKQYPLPGVAKNGYVLNLESKDAESIKLRLVSPRNENVLIVGQVRGNMMFKKTTRANREGVIVDVQTKSFANGIMQLTLFDKYDIPRCERMVYLPSENNLDIKLSTDKKEYQPREKVELTVQTLDSDSIPVPANVSLAVVNDKVVSFANDKQDNILSWFLMSSELKGEIHEPSFYYDTSEAKADSAIDLIMLTHGWRRFKWEELLKQEFKVNFYPEKATNVTGRIVNSKTNQAVMANVTLLEIDNNQRAAQLTTKDDGSFVFQNVNPFAMLKILAKAPGIRSENLRILIDNNPAPSLGAIQPDNTQPFLPVLIKEQPQELEKGVERKFKQEQNINAILEPDMNELEEVVVLGYGIQRKKDLTGAVTVVNAKDIGGLQDVEQALGGRAAGVQVINHAPGIGEAANVRIRGVGAIDSNEPLYVVDGVPVNNLPDSKLSPIGYLSPEEIESIQILKDAAATGLYGNKASNGVIVITTKNNKNHNGFSKTRKSPKFRYQVADVPVKSFSRVREFYSPEYSTKEKVEERNDFRTTVYWNPEVKTDKNGKATVSFYNNDEISTFRVTSEGIGPNGMIGRSEHTYFTQLPFTIDAKIPPYLCFGDTIKIQAVFKNNTPEKITGHLKVDLPENIRPLEKFPDEMTIPGKSAITVPVTGFVKNIRGKGKLRIAFKSRGLKDAVVNEVDVQPKGFPVEASVSGNETDKTYTFNISDPLEGSVKAKFSAFPDVSSNLMAGIESILREPYGCFEQTSSSTYPNVMVLQYLKETGTNDPKIYKRASGLIDKGYKRLISFETTEKGYEWFGYSPAHESLTAYGLMEFTDMSEVYDKVDKKMIERTITYLMKRRDGSGNFKQNSKALDSFGRASQKVTNAYIVYALTEAGVMDIQKEFNRAYEEAVSSKDAYRASLMAGACFNLKKNEKGEKLLDIVRAALKKGDFEALNIEHSITRSYGKSLQVETASVYLLALLKSPNKKIRELAEVAGYIMNSRCNGGFGSTQATVLALKSLTEFAKYSKHTESSGTIKVYVNNLLAAEKSYEPGHKGEIVLGKLENYLVAGENIVRVLYDETEDALPYTLDFSWTSLTPNSSGKCVVDLSTKIASGKVKIGETVRLTAQLKNKTSIGQPMTMAIIGIPSGLGLQPWQLKELQEKKVFDYYEVRQNYLVAYYRQMKPNEQRIIKLDLKAEVPGSYLAPASSAYLYYTNEFKDWEAGSAVEINK